MLEENKNNFEQRISVDDNNDINKKKQEILSDNKKNLLIGLKTLLMTGLTLFEFYLLITNNEGGILNSIFFILLYMICSIMALFCCECFGPTTQIAFTIILFIVKGLFLSLIIYALKIKTSVVIYGLIGINVALLIISIGYQIFMKKQKQKMLLL